jgi:hypothetical protein
VEIRGERLKYLRVRTLYGLSPIDRLKAECNPLGYTFADRFREMAGENFAWQRLTFAWA